MLTSACSSPRRASNTLAMLNLLTYLQVQENLALTLFLHHLLHHYRCDFHFISVKKTDQNSCQQDYQDPAEEECYRLPSRHLSTEICSKHVGKKQSLANGIIAREASQLPPKVYTLKATCSFLPCMIKTTQMQPSCMQSSCHDLNLEKEVCILEQ